MPRKEAIMKSPDASSEWLLAHSRAAGWMGLSIKLGRWNQTPTLQTLKPGKANQRDEVGRPKPGQRHRRSNERNINDIYDI